VTNTVPPRGKFRKSVLVVEDDPSLRQMLVRTLSTRFTVHEAADGLVASELLGRIPPPDLVVCDVMMPKIDGYSLVRLIRSTPALRGIQVIFLTAKTETQNVIQGIQLGAKHYLQKPFSVTDLLDKVTKLLG
jgi:DNA-binding response OmpR family regulator